MDETSTPPVAAAPVAAAPVATPRPRRLWRWVLLGLLVLALAALGLGARWAWHSEATVSWLLSQVPGLQVQGVQGSLASRQIRIAQLDWEAPRARWPGQRPTRPGTAQSPAHRPTPR